MIPTHTKEIAKSVSEKISTPFYFIDIDSILSSYKEILAAWKHYFTNFKVAYSYKTNSLKAITQSLCQLKACAEVVSGTELNWALSDGFLPRNIFFDGPMKTLEELTQALFKGVSIQADSLEELETLISLSKTHRLVPRLSLRLSTGYREEGLSRFGLVEEEYFKAFTLIKQANYVGCGLHFHVGSNVNEPKMYSDAIQKYKHIIHHAIDNCGDKIWVDIGGGFPAKSVKKEVAPLPTKSFATAVYEAFKSNNFPLDKIELIIEPGRCLVEDHGFLVAKVIVRKERNGKKILVTDAGLNLLRSMNTWYHPIEFLENEATGRLSAYSYNLYGSNCFESDLIACDFIVSHEVDRGEIIIIGSVGGYDIPSANVWIRSAPPIFAKLRDAILQVRRLQQPDEIRALQYNLLELPHAFS